jgi:hypothetical protein
MKIRVFESRIVGWALASAMKNRWDSGSDGPAAALRDLRASAGQRGTIEISIVVT